MFTNEKKGLKNALRENLENKTYRWNDCLSVFVVNLQQKRVKEGSEQVAKSKKIGTS